MEHDKKSKTLDIRSSAPYISSMDPSTPIPGPASRALAAPRVRWWMRAVEGAAVLVWLAAAAIAFAAGSWLSLRGRGSP